MTDYSTAAMGTTDRSSDSQLREMNEELLISSIRQHELAEQAYAAELSARESEERFRAIADNIPQLAWMADATGWVGWFNRRWLEYTGTKLEENQGLGWKAVHHPAHVDRVTEKFLHHLRVGHDWEDTFPLRGKDGEYRWFLSRMKAIRDETGKVVRFFGTNTDVTDQRNIEEALRASERQRQLALDSAELGSWHVDPATNLLRSDERFRVIFGAAGDWLTYEEAFAIIHPDDRDRIRDAVAAATRPENPAPYEAEYRVVHPDGSIRCVFAKGRANFAGKGPERRFVSFDGTVADITERSRIERLATEQSVALVDLHRRKDEFLAMLSHELRNPLAPIANAVQLLRLRKDEDQIQEHARSVIERQVTQLTRLVDDLMEVSRITTGRVQLRLDRVVVGGIVERAVETAQPLMHARRQELIVSLPPEPIYLNADAARLEQVVVNLLTNAAKYTDEEGRIWLTVLQEGEQCVLRVRDTGVGIAPDLLPRIFDLFTQAERSLDRSQGGLGIGLALVDRLVAMHGGRVEVHSSLGQGSEFVVHLPTMPSSAPPPPSPEEAPDPAGRSLRVLIVDDNADAASSLAMLLKIAGHQCRTAHDGPAALETAPEYRPDVVLLDIGLPGLNGYEVAKRLRRGAAFKNLTLIALTGYGSDADRRLSEEAGFDHHLVKPVGAREVQRLLGKVAERR